MNTSDSQTDFERNVVLELAREHEHIRQVHKINLRPIAIVLFDSETRWGQFDERARAISISRKLIKEHSWQTVLGVLRHEMAHQLVAQENANHSVNLQKPHGELFRAACKRLGVPEQFTKAGLDLQTNVLDWRIEPRDPATEKILERARKLLALASSTNEHEALLAMERVRELYAKYNLEHMASAGNDSFVHLVISHGKKRVETWEQRIVSVLLEHFFVTALTFKQYDPIALEKVRATELIGTRENVLMADYVYHFLYQQTEFLADEASRTQRICGRSERNSFKLGVLEGFSKKLRSGEKSMHEANPTPTPVGNALAKFRGDTKLDNYLAGIYPNLVSSRRSAPRVDANAYYAGSDAGKSITLNKPITTQMGNLGRVIHGK
jgi:hypothetical protein